MRKIKHVKLEGEFLVVLSEEEYETLERLLRSIDDDRGTERRVKQRRTRSEDRRDMETRLFRHGGDSKEYGRRFGIIDRRG